MRNLNFILLIAIILFSTFSFAFESKNKINSVVAIFSDDGFGSGVLISKEGFILSNWHVIKGSKQLEVLLAQDKHAEVFRKVKIIKFDKSKDLVLLKLKDAPANLNFLSISANYPKVGDEVHAFGHPEGEFWSYTKGYLSAHRHNYTAKFINNVDKNIEESFDLFQGDVYQTQTPIFPGNSGGPLLNKFGNLIGINTFTNHGSSLMSFSITNEEIIKFLIN